MFARAVDSNELIKNALENVIFLNIDCEKGEGIEIAKKYGVNGYPTFLMTNAKGEVTDGWIGYPGPEKWASYVTAGNTDRRTIAEKKSAYEKAADKSLACALANHAATGYKFADSVKYLRKARELDPANANDYTSEILTNMYYGSRGGSFTLEEVEDEGLAILGNSDSSPDTKVDLARLVKTLASNGGEPEKAIPYIKAALTASEGIEDLAEARMGLEIDEALLITKDLDKAVDLKRKSMREGWLENSGQLNEFAWWCFENNVNLDEAEDLALKGAELAATDGERANILDTAAEICNARGNCDEAIARIKQAIELDPDKQYLKDQLARFEKVLEGKISG